MRQSHRTAGLGSIQVRRDSKQNVYVYAPQTKGVAKVLLCKCDTRHAGERALNAWHVICALVWLYNLGAACVRQSA